MLLRQLLLLPVEDTPKIQNQDCGQYKVSKGSVKKRRKKVEFTTDPPPLSVEKKAKNDLRAMKRNLYDMGHLTLVRWLLQRAFKFEPPFRPGSKLKRVPPTPHPKIKKSMRVFK